jgi:hypothetical protein
MQIVLTKGRVTFLIACVAGAALYFLASRLIVSEPHASISLARARRRKPLDSSTPWATMRAAASSVVP